MAELTRTPLIAAGVLMGAGLGGFIDGIMLHQILQWHNMLSSQMPPNDLVSAKVNMTWDGYFHLAVWVLTPIGGALQICSREYSGNCPISLSEQRKSINRLNFQMTVSFGINSLANNPMP